MAWTRVLHRAGSLRGVAGLAAAGVLGDLIVTGARRFLPENFGRRVAVRTMAGGIVVTRRLESAAEEARLLAGDLLAEARASLGEEATVPAEGNGAAGHEH
ncbi:MAG: DUF1490 family protein [Actinomycetota bacterium]|jgi:hypothetical protein